MSQITIKCITYYVSLNVSLQIMSRYGVIINYVEKYYEVRQVLQISAFLQTTSEQLVLQAQNIVVKMFTI